MENRRIVIADDHFVVRSGLRMVLEGEPGFDVVGEAWDVRSTMRCLGAHRPDVLLLDLNMPGESSVAALPRIAAEFPETAVLMLTMQGRSTLAREALRRGARGYVRKDAADTDLIDAVRALDGDDDGEVVAALASQLALNGHPPDGAPDGLTRRELEILRLVVGGHENTEIAERLTIGVRTVAAHRQRIGRKLGRSTRAELVRYALEHGLLGAPSP